MKAASALTLLSVLSLAVLTFSEPLTRCAVDASGAVAGLGKGAGKVVGFGSCQGGSATALSLASSSDGKAKSSARASSSSSSSSKKGKKQKKGFLPFKAPGVLDSLFDSEDGEGFDFEDLEAFLSFDRSDRPKGQWSVVVESELTTSAFDAWGVARNVGYVLQHGLKTFGAEVRSLDHEGKNWIIEFDSGKQIVVALIETNPDLYYHLVEIERHTGDFFESTSSIDGSRFYIQFVAVDDANCVVEFGWGGGKANGDISNTVIAIGSFGQEMVRSFEEKFGKRCEGSHKFRTIEGDCNNLGDTRRGAAGHALIRLGGEDPAFPDNDSSNPAGALNISPRVISNAMCSTSPGAKFLENEFPNLKGECFDSSKEGETWTVCPLEEAKMVLDDEEVYVLKYDDVYYLKDDSLVFTFKGDDCKLDINLYCGGTPELLIAPEPCGSMANKLVHPMACRIAVGDDDVLSNEHGLTDLFWTFGQFIDHDVGLTPVTAIASRNQPGFSRIFGAKEAFNIEVPKDDFFISDKEMEFERTRKFVDPKRGLHENQHSSYVDLGQVYGADYLRSRALRSYTGGKLKTSNGNLPPYNRLDGEGALGARVENAMNAEEDFFVVGDVRGNEQTLLLAMHILWMREHNLVADEISALFPEWDDEEIYQTARAICIAEYQSIVFTEFIPLMLGKDAVPAGSYSYDSSCDASITAIFSTVAYRFGHTMVGSNLMDMGPGKRKNADVSLIPLRDVFFQPKIIENQGIDGFMRGGAWHKCKQFDIKVVDELRNFLFTKNSEEGHLDLVSLNVQRARDMGIPSFNAVRRLHGLPEYISYYDFMDPREAFAADKVYGGDIDICDAFIGGLAEKPHEDSILGETFFTIVKNQFTNFRDCDRFYYKGIEWDADLLSSYPRLNEIVSDKVKLADVIVRNTYVTYEELGNRSNGSVMQI